MWVRRKEYTVTTYFVQCKSCKKEIVLDIKPRGQNIATAFSATWERDLRCDCRDIHRYKRADIKDRYEP